MAAFTVWDYLIVLAVLICSSAIGLYYRFTGGKQKTTKEYLLADRSMTVLPLSFSLMTTYMSAVTVLGLTQENYQYGTMFSAIDMSYVLATPIIVHLLLPVFYRLKTASVYEYLEQRFGYATRLCASLVYSLQMILYMGIALVAPAITLQAVTGVNRNFSVITVGFVCTFYATLGGIKAVLITDVFQSLLMFVSIYSVIIGAAIKAGGLAEIWHIAEAGNRINFSDIRIDPTVRHTWWTQVFGGIIIYLSMFGVNPAQVQRILTAKTLTTAKSAMWVCLPILVLLSLSGCFAGLSIYSYYRNCDPLLEGRITSREQLMPLFVMDTTSHLPGLPGLFVAGIFSASLSTISAVISSLATVTLEDAIKPLWLIYRSVPLEEKKVTITVKLLNVFFGLLCIGMAYLSSLLGGLLQAALSIFGILGGPLLGIFINGMFMTFTNQKGVITGLFTAIIISMWIGFGQPKPSIPMLHMSTAGCPITRSATTTIKEIFLTATLSEKENIEYFYLYKISYMWYPVIGFIISLLMGMLCSFIFSKLGWDDNSALYRDPLRLAIKHELLVAPIAKRLLKKQHTIVLETAPKEYEIAHIS